MSHKLFDQSDLTAFIAGSSRGLWYYFVEGVAEAGACVVLDGVNLGRLANAAQTL